MKVWDKYYECSCHTQTIMAHYEEEVKTVDLAFFENCIDGRVGLKQRLRFCWKILTTGEPWADMVILDKEEAEALGKDLVEFVNKK